METATGPMEAQLVHRRGRLTQMAGAVERQAESNGDSNWSSGEAG